MLQERRRQSAGQAEGPFVLVDKARGALRIAALNAAALESGLKAGMALADARACLPALRVGETDPQADADLLQACATLCEMFTPLVALDGADGVLLDVTGCAHLFGGEEGLRMQARRTLARLGLHTRAVVADTPDAARALARHGAAKVVPPGETAAFVAGLPLAALDLGADTHLALGRAGFRAVGELAERPSQALTARFGAGLATKLARLMGREDIRLTPLRDPPACMAERHFPEPLGAMDSLMAVLERLGREVGAILERRGEGGRLFEASFFRTDGAVRRIVVETAQPLRDAPGLLRLVRLKIDALADPLDPGFGFDALRLAVRRAEPFDQSQADLEGKPDPDGDVAALVDRLVARFGRAQVLRFAARDSHDPLRAAALEPAAAPAAPWPEPDPGQPPSRPVTLFDPPQAIEALAEVPDGPPLRFRWRRVLHDVARAEGPERIAPEWWRVGARPPATRDYYRVENGQGRRFWVFREGFHGEGEGRPRWFLHGLFA
ncbi:Y-family DNA polymerase [Alsobacter soli]|uniref:Y-family DNA polymerase n=1 Tax=Alsobacter soli TaxID=2109933 RepID=UPI001AECF81B